ncbi:MAG: arylamine N-acetyltransferase [Acidobacteriia bacterium]|nr:arylamine N-acetyltransferase [Terriglobia bacterium]
MPTLPDPYCRYLRLLGVEGRPSGLDGLRLLVRRHLFRVPFENLTKLLLFAREGVGRLATLEEFLDGIEHRDLGGTCHSTNPFLAALLHQLGYDAVLYGADISQPNSHTSIRVHLEGVPYHVDVGYGGPFRVPMRLDRLPFEFQEGDLRYLLNPNDGEDAYEMAVYSGQRRVHGYVVHGPPRPMEFFTPGVCQSFAPGRAFMSCLRLVRIFDDHSVELRDRTLTVHRGAETNETELHDRTELRAAVARDLQMPRCPMDAALDVLEQLTGTPLFGRH